MVKANNAEKDEASSGPTFSSHDVINHENQPSRKAITKAPDGLYPKPIASSFNTFQIDAARRMHMLTINSRMPPRFKTPNSDPRDTKAGQSRHFHDEKSSESRSPDKNEQSTTDKDVQVQVPAMGCDDQNCQNPRCAHCGAVIIPAPAATFPFKDTPSISINDWEIYTARKPILTKEEIEHFESILGVPVPEMIFGNNKVEVLNSNKNLHICFNSLDALRTVSVDNKDILKVSYADEWFKSRAKAHHNDDDVLMEIIKPYDWTYTTHYFGTDLTVPEGGFVHDDSYTIPHDKLTKHNPILFFNDMTLFEDELGDNGISTLNIKIRVMHDCMLVLQRSFVRVDNVLVRIHDTRLYVDFEENLVVREFKRQQQDYDKLLNLAAGHSDPKKLLRDMQWCSMRLPVVDVRREYAKLS